LETNVNYNNGNRLEADSDPSLHEEKPWVMSDKLTDFGKLPYQWNYLINVLSVKRH